MSNTDLAGSTAQYAMMGAPLGPAGMIAGGILGAFAGVSASRRARRLKRKARHAEIMQGVRTAEYSMRVGEAGRRTAGTQRAAQGASGIGGRTTTSLTADTARQFYREQYQIMAGVSNALRKGGARNKYAFKYLMEGR